MLDEAQTISTVAAAQLARVFTPRIFARHDVAIDLIWRLPSSHGPD
jgi:glyoxylate carboligase